MQILTHPNPFLQRVCRCDFVIRLDDINQMLFLLHEQNGLALAAPQVGIDARFFVTTWGDVFVNPIIMRVADPIKIMERCLSLPGETYGKRRWSTIELATGQILKDIHAIVVQHEVDHLNGRLICD